MSEEITNYTPDNPSATDFICTFLAAPVPGEIAGIASRKDSQGRAYIATGFGQGGQGVKLERRELDGSLTFLGRIWPAPGFNCAGFDILLDPPYVVVFMDGHDLHALDPTQRNNGKMWFPVNAGVPAGAPASAEPQEYGANIPAAPAAPEPNAVTPADFVAAEAGAWLGDHNTRANFARYFLDMFATAFDRNAAKTPEQQRLADAMATFMRDRDFEADTDALTKAGLPPK